MLVVFELAVVHVAVRKAARADVDAGRLAVEVALGQRDDRVTVGRSSVVAEGGALSGLSLAGAWYGRRPGAWLGGAARVSAERFALRSSGGEASEVVVSGGEGRAALAMRWVSGGGRFQLEGQLGYAWLRLPLARREGQLGAGLVEDALTAHGPAARATVSLLLRPWLGLELMGDALPLTFGGAHRGATLAPRRFNAGGSVSVGALAAGNARLAAVVSGEISTTSGGTGGNSLDQDRRLLAVGLRASWPPPATNITPRPPAPAPPPPPPPLPAAVEPEPAPPPAPSLIAGVVRSTAGAPLAARVRLLELGLELPVSTTGAFRVEVPPGLYTLIIEAPGFIEQRKQVQAGSAEQRIYNVDLQPESP